MNKKALIVSAAAVLCVTAAGVFIFLFSQRQETDVSSPALASEETSFAAESLFKEETFLPSDADSADPDISYDDHDHHDADAPSDMDSVRYSVSRVLDGASGQEVQSRVALGASYADSYLLLGKQGGFELFFPSLSGGVRRGEYTISGNTVGVVYEDGKGAEYSCLFSADHTSVDTVIVPYGEYHVYFSVNE